MSVLKNIWRPDDPSRKGPGSHNDSGLTERLAELLGREIEELEDSKSDSASNKNKDSVTQLPPPELGDGQEQDHEPERLEITSQTSIYTEIEEKISSPGSPDTGARLHAESSSWQSATADEPVRLATDEALLQLRAFEEEIESKLRNRAEDYAQALETAMNGLPRSAEPEKSAGEIGEQFRTEARGWFDEARQELREQLEMSRASLEEELKRNHAQLIETAQQKIDSIAQASLDAGVHTVQQNQDQEQATRTLMAQVEASHRQTEAATQNLATATEQALARLHAFEERIESGFRSQVEDYRRAVETAAKDLEHKGISQAKFQQAAEDLQRLTDQVLDRSTKRIEERAEFSMTRLSEKLSAVEQSLGGAARAAMEGALIEQQHRLSQAWQENSRAAVETVTRAGQQCQEQLAAARKAAEEEFRGAVREQGRQIMEETAAELRKGQFQEKLIRDVTGQAEQAARETMTRSTADLSKQSEAVLSGLSGKLQNSADQFLSDVQQRLNQAGRAWFESAGQSVQREYQSRISQWLDEQTRATQQKAQEAEQSVARLTDQAATRLEMVSRDAEASLRERVQQQQQQWLESALEEARKSGFQQKVIDHALADMESRAGQLLDQATKRLADHADSARTAIAGELDASAKKLLEGAEASLEKISWQHRGRLAQWWEERNQTARREGEAAAAALAQASQQATSQLRSVQAEMESQMNSRAREYQARLVDSAMEDLRRNGALERAVSDAAMTLRTNANEVMARSGEQIRDQVDAARLALDNQAQASRRGLAEELAKKIEQAQSSVESAGKAVTEDYRRQLSVWWEERTQSARRESEELSGAVSRSARQASEQLQAARKDMETELQSGMQNYRKGLRDAAAEELRRQGFQKELLDSIAAELDKSAKELAERSTKELQKHIDTSLSGVDEKVKAARQSFLDDTQKQLADMTRTSLDMTTTRFHELLTRNVQDLEKEQEDWLQRKRESVWLEINKGGGAPGGNRQHASLMGGAETRRGVRSGGGMLGRLLMVAAVIAVAAALTAVFVRVMPRGGPVMEMQLPTNPPAGFIAENPNAGAQVRARELQFGQAYWMLAVNDLQHKYAYNTPLPATPPPEFRVDANGLRDNAALRTLYWNKLRQLWKTPADWHKVAVSNGNGVTSALNWLKMKLTQPQTTSPSASSNN